MNSICPFCEKIDPLVILDYRDKWVFDCCKNRIKKDRKDDNYYVFRRKIGDNYFISKFRNFNGDDEYMHYDGTLYHICGEDGFFVTEEAARRVLNMFSIPKEFIEEDDFTI